MTKSEIRDIKKELEDNLDSKRYEHTLGVAYTAACLAMRYGYNMEKAYIAGLLHDCAKCMSNKDKIEYCEKHDIPINSTEQANPSLLHAKVGAEMSRRKYDIDDSEIYQAIQYHTTGHPNMTLLDKILYIADYMEPHRDEAPNLDLVRKQVFINIDTALFTILKDSVDYLDSSDKPVDPMTMETYLYYVKQEN